MTLFFLLLIASFLRCADKNIHDKKTLNVPPLDLSILKKDKNPKRGKRYTREELRKIREQFLKDQQQRPASEPKDK